MSNRCRMCKTDGSMEEKSVNETIEVRGKALDVEDLRHLECDQCGAQVERPAQIDHNARQISKALENSKIVDAVIEDRAKTISVILRMHQEHKHLHNHFEYVVLCLEAEWGKDAFDKAMDRMMMGFDYDHPCAPCATRGRASCPVHGWEKTNHVEGS